MKVLQVTREMPGEERYGLGRAVSQLMTGLRRQGVESVRWCAADLAPSALRHASRRAGRWARHLRAPELRPVLEIASRAFEVGHAAAPLAARLRCTHVHLHDSAVAGGYLHAAGASALPWGTTHHGFESIAVALQRHFPGGIGAALGVRIDAVERAVVQGSAWSIFPTALGRDRLIADLGLSQVPRQSRVVAHARPDWKPAGREAARRQLGWGADTRGLLAVGQLIPAKRIDWIVRALRGADPRWRLLVLGEGDTGGLLRAAHEAGVAPPQVLATDLPAPYYAAADAFVSASATEAFGMAHLEALACGLPLACTAVGGVPEVVGTAALLLPDDEAGFASGLQGWLADDAARLRLALLARSRGALWPGVDAVARRHGLIYGAARW